MTTLERKNYLKSKIDSTEDFEILEKIEKLFEESDEIYVLSDEQILSVKEANAEYLRGESTSHEDEMKEMEKWFKEQEK